MAESGEKLPRQHVLHEKGEKAVDNLKL